MVALGFLKKITNINFYFFFAALTTLNFLIILYNTNNLLYCLGWLFFILPVFLLYSIAYTPLDNFLFSLILTSCCLLSNFQVDIGREIPIILTVQLYFLWYKNDFFFNNHFRGTLFLALLEIFLTFFCLRLDPEHNFSLLSVFENPLIFNFEDSNCVGENVPKAESTLAPVTVVSKKPTGFFGSLAKVAGGSVVTETLSQLEDPKTRDNIVKIAVEIIDQSVDKQGAKIGANHSLEGIKEIQRNNEALTNHGQRLIGLGMTVSVLWLVGKGKILGSIIKGSGLFGAVNSHWQLNNDYLKNAKLKIEAENAISQAKLEAKIRSKSILGFEDIIIPDSIFIKKKAPYHEIEFDTISDQFWRE